MRASLLWGLCVWLAAAGVLWAVNSALDLAAKALVLVLAAALAALTWPIWASLLASALAVLVFNWCLVPPRGAFSIDLRQHAVLLAVMLCVSWMIAMVVAAQRRLSAALEQQLQLTSELREWGDALRAVDDPLDQGPALCRLLQQSASAPPVLMMLVQALPRRDDSAALRSHGPEPDADMRAGLWLCLRQSGAMGPCTGRHEEQPCWFLPLRARGHSLGAVAVPLGQPLLADEQRLAHAQALCDQMGQALERAQAKQAARQAREQAQTQASRNALLAAISHDYRTPLATMLGAASSLQDQGERLQAAQRARLLHTLIAQIEALRRMTDNTLQLARLEVPGLHLRVEWESVEELLGAALRRAREAQSVQGRAEPTRLRARLEPGLPLLRCDALLISQMLDNLIDNALKYSAAPQPVEIWARLQADQLVLAVRDRGPGVPSEWRERIFETFERAVASASAPGSGVGLAVCRAIARAHGGELRLRPRGHGGSSFEAWLPLPAEAPGLAPEAAA
jgi:two-component system sensor histidine kinase KdpD